MDKKIEYLGDNYTIDIDGVVKNLQGRVIKHNISNSGYKYVTLKINGKTSGRFIHRAICIAFKENYSNKEYVNHIDGDKLNNSIDNLEWVTASENNIHAYNNGLKKYRPLHYKGKFGSEHNRSKKVVCIETGEEFGSMSEAGRKLNISISSVSWSIKNKKPIFGMHFELTK